MFFAKINGSWKPFYGCYTVKELILTVAQCYGYNDTLMEKALVGCKTPWECIDMYNMIASEENQIKGLVEGGTEFLLDKSELGIAE